MKLLLGAAIGAAALVAALGANGGTARGVPRGFDPESMAAASPNDVWLLGTYVCGSEDCNAIVRSRDRGRTFLRVGAPPLPTQGTVPELHLADRRNGYVFADSLLYATHDGGTSWRRVSLGTVFALATADGRAYVVTGHGLESSSVSGDTWRRIALPFEPVAVGAFGPNVWVLGTHAPRDRLARSLDGGRTFTVGAATCYPGLGGELEPASADVVWAICPTGMEAGASISVDGGKSFHDVFPPYELINAVAIAPASARTAVLTPGVSSRPFLRTTDSGAHWTRARTPPRGGSVFGLGFADAHTGFALVQVGDAKQVLWRTTDAGATWHAVPIR